jgi:hypothetical protein
MYGGDSPPPAPDYSGLAKEQGAANVEAAKQTAYLSNANISNPYGKRTVTYNTTYATPEPVKPTATYKPLTREQAEAYLAEQGNPKYVNGIYSSMSPGKTAGFDARKGWEEDVANVMAGKYPGSQGYVDQAAYDKAMADYNKQYADWKASALTTPTVTEELTPEEQAIFNTNQQVRKALGDLGVTSMGNVNKVMSTPFKYQGPDIMTGLDLSNVAKMPVNAGTTGQQAIMARLQPQLEARREAMRTSLINQGVPPGSEAYQNAMTELSQQENDMTSQAALQGLNLDMAANQAGFGQALQSANFGNTANEQAFQRQLGLYNLPLNQVSALMAGSQVNVPQFQGYQGAGVTATPYFQAGQAQNQYNMDRYNADVSQSNAQMGVFGSLGGAGIIAA